MIALAVIGHIDCGQQEIIANIVNQVNEFIDDLLIIDFYKNNKLVKMIDNYNKSNIIKINFDDCNSWDEIHNKIKKMLEKNNIDEIFLVRTPLVNGMKYGESVTFERFEKGIITREDYSFNFLFSKFIFEKIMFVKVASQMNKKIIQLCIDPLEVDFSSFYKFKYYKRYYTLKDEHSKYCPMYEYEMQKRNSILKNNVNKELDLFFIASIMSYERKWLYELNKEINNIKHNYNIYFNIFDSKENKNNRINQIEYYKNLAKSKYTLVIKPYSHKTFSIIRFFEAINLGCIPLIYYDVNLDEVRDTFKDIYEIILKADLVVSGDNLVHRINNYEKDKHIIEDIISTKSYKKITDYKKVKNFYDKLISCNDGKE